MSIWAENRKLLGIRRSVHSEIWFGENLSDFRRNRNSWPELYVLKVFLKIFHNSKDKTCAGVSFLIKLQSQIRDSGRSAFLWIFPIFLRTPFLQSTSGRLVLEEVVFVYNLGAWIIAGVCVILGSKFKSKN